MERRSSKGRTRPVLMDDRGEKTKSGHVILPWNGIRREIELNGRWWPQATSRDSVIETETQ